MKISQSEIKRVSKLISSKLYDNQRKEEENFLNNETGNILKNAESDISRLEKMVIDFNIKYKTKLNISTYANTIAESLIRIHSDKISNKYIGMRDNIDTYLFTVQEISENYNDFIDKIEKKYNIILK